MKGVWLEPSPGRAAVVFVHGVLSNSESCWTHSDGTHWPALVAEQFRGKVGVYVFTYRTNVISAGFSVGDVTASLREHLRLDGVLSNEQIIFVCHSMGGIVVRKFIVRYQDQLHDSKVKIGLFLLGSPSIGSRYANMLGPLIAMFRHSQGEVLKFSSKNLWLNELDTDFNNLRISGSVQIFGRELIEDKAVTRLLFWQQVVEPFAGARYFGDPYKVPGTNHFTICKVSGTHDIQHRILCAFLSDFEAWADAGRTSEAQKTFNDGKELKLGMNSLRDQHKSEAEDVDVPIPVFQAPNPPSSFVERPEIENEIRGLLLSSSDEQALVVSAIQGLGGIGKTALASHIASNAAVQRRFTDGVLWATLGQTPDLQQWLNNWIQALGDYDFKSNNAQSASRHLQSILRDRSILIVVDDVWSSMDARLFLVGGPKCKTLLTTRLRDLAGEVGAQLYEIGLLSEEQSFALVEKKLGRTLALDERDPAGEMIKAVGYLPLAVELVAAQVVRGTPWFELIQAFGAEVARLEALESPRQRRSGTNRLEACFNLSLSRLRHQDENGWRAFVLLGVLPEDTPFDSLIVSHSQGISLQDADDITELLYDDALTMRSVASKAKGTSDHKTYRLHDLLYGMACRLLIASPPKGLGLTLERGHTALIENYAMLRERDSWASMPDDGYIRRHLIRHCAAANASETIQDILNESDSNGENAWYTSNEKYGYASGFSEDVAFAIARTWSEIGRDFSHKLFVRSVQYVLSASSVNSIASSSPPELMVARVKAGLWTPEQALSYARLVRNRLRRLEALAFLMPFQEAASANEMSKVLCAELIKDASISAEEVCGFLARDLPPDVQNMVYARLLASERFYGIGRARAEAIFKLAPFMSEQQRQLLLDEILQWRDKGIEQIIGLAGLLPYISGEEADEVESVLKADVDALSPYAGWARIYAKACMVGTAHMRGKGAEVEPLGAFLQSVPNTYSTKRMLALKLLPAATRDHLSSLQSLYGQPDETFVRTLVHRLQPFGEEDAQSLLSVTGSPYLKAIICSSAAMSADSTSSCANWLKLASEQAAVLTDQNQFRLNYLVFKLRNVASSGEIIDFDFSEASNSTRLLLAMASLVFRSNTVFGRSREDFIMHLMYQPSLEGAKGLSPRFEQFRGLEYARGIVTSYSFDQLKTLLPSIKTSDFEDFRREVEDVSESTSKTSWLEDSDHDFEDDGHDEEWWPDKHERRRLRKSLSYLERRCVLVDKYIANGGSDCGWTKFIDEHVRANDIDLALIFAIGLQERPFTLYDLMFCSSKVLESTFVLPSSFLQCARNERRSMSDLTDVVGDLVRIGPDSTRDTALFLTFFLQCLVPEKEKNVLEDINMALRKVEGWWQSASSGQK